MSHAYRSVYEHMIGAKLAEREAAYAAALPWLDRLGAIQRGRIARMIAGSVGISGAVALALTAALSSDEEPVLVLAGAILAMLGSWVVARVVLGLAAVGRRATAFAPPALSGDLKTDLELLETADPLRALEQRLVRSEGFGIDLLAIAICLLAPLTLHLLFVLAINGYDARGFSTWIRISLLLVGHGHIALAILTARYTKRLRNDPFAGKTSIHRAWGRAFGWTIAVTCLPGILLVAVPPLLAAVTALAFVPLLFLYIQGRHHADHALIELATAAQPMSEEIRIGESAAAYEAVVEEPELSVASATGLLAGRS